VRDRARFCIVARPATGSSLPLRLTTGSEQKPGCGPWPRASVPLFRDCGSLGSASRSAQIPLWDCAIALPGGRRSPSSALDTSCSSAAGASRGGADVLAINARAEAKRSAARSRRPPLLSNREESDDEKLNAPTRPTW